MIAPALSGFRRMSRLFRPRFEPSPVAFAAALALLACDPGGRNPYEQVGPPSNTAGGTGGTGTSTSGGSNSGGASGGTVSAGGTAGSGDSGGSAGIAGSAGTAASGAAGDAGSAGSGGSAKEDAFELLGAPLAFAPTAQGFGISVVLKQGDPEKLLVRIRAEGEQDYGEPKTPMVLASDLAEFHFDGLDAGTRYEYQVVVAATDAEEAGEELLYEGSVVTQRPPGASYSIALISDPHIGANLAYHNQGDETILRAVGAEIAAMSPDFVLNLGDMLDFHEYGFNSPPPDGSVTRLAYLNYRWGLGDALRNSAHFTTIGNWDGENGDFPAEAIAWSREQRLLYVPGPKPTTYPEGGNAWEDYYAFTWGDALFVVLNVMTYTPTPHLLSFNPGVPDDWTLGQEQLEWLERTLKNATSKWRFLVIHHAVGGKAGDEINGAYGRGGGQAANVGEQAIVHRLMLDHGVQIFFYGHDHVFTDMVVDGIHYTEPGSAGAIWMFSGLETGYTQYWA
ncbi:MAG: metallophosphoesterase, partial [Pseudomonadota bacterium]